MALIKVFSPSGWDFDAPVATRLKIASDGRMGPNDRRDFVKRAGIDTASVFEKEIERLKIARDMLPIHLLAVGASEMYGPNRNGDGFRGSVLSRTHDTFVKHARWFRNHKNKPHEGHPSFGQVKLSGYSPRMHRVELFCLLPLTKEAAERMGVTGPADKEAEDIDAGRDIAVSMACRVPYDVCSGCQNKARTTQEYCKEANCKYGGCANNLTRLIKTAGDVHLLHVDNVDPTFFDISRVWRPADRIAYGGRADYIKTAADNGGFYGVGGAKTAEDLGLTAPMSVVYAQDVLLPGQWSSYLSAQVKLAHGLAALDQQPEKWAGDDLRRAFSDKMQPEMPLEALGLDSDKPEKVAAAVGALADRKIVIPLRDFARLTKRADVTGSAAECMKGVYYRMITDGSLESRLTNNRYAPIEKLASAAQRTLAFRLAPEFSLEKSAVSRRCSLSIVRGHEAPKAKSVFWVEKTAHDKTAAEELARDYACYKVAALHRISQFDDQFLLTARLAACQNQVI